MTYRHPNNPNLTLTYESDYHGLPLLPKHGPYIESYLDKIIESIRRALDKHRRVTAIRFDLRIPSNCAEPDSQVITRFFESLKAKLASNQLRKARHGLRVHSCDLSYVWVKERSTSHHRHYHCCILLNGDAYYHLGSFRPGVGGDQRQGNMAVRIRSAWASALGIHWEKAKGLVNFPPNRVYHLDANSETIIWQVGDLFQRLSYFAKADTKNYENSQKCFGCSRK